MATVYRALHLNLDREVAIKVMDPAMNADESFSERFIREARISARLTHPHILQIYDVNTFNGLNYIAMELLGGGELADFIHEAMPQRQIYMIVKQMSEALDYAAGRGYVHRDIKPSNIMLRGPEDFVLADFGIARAANSGTQMTQTGLMVGTPSYMSPEQAKGEEVDGRSDLYALGVLTYEMFTKQLPYESDSAVTTAVKHLTEAIPTLPEKLSAYQPFINKALAKSREERFQTGAELYAAMMEASAGFADDEVLTPAAPPRPSRVSAQSTSNIEPTSLSGAGSTRLSGSSSSVVSGSSRPYRLEGSEQRERLVSGAYDSGRRKKKKSGSSAPFLGLVILLLAAGGGGYYWWQGQGKPSGERVSQRALASELASAYSAMNDDKLALAASSFTKVLDIDSRNSAALDGKNEVGRLFSKAIESAVEKGDSTRARQLLTDYGLYFSEAANLSDLKAAIELADEEKRLADAQSARVAKLLGQASQAIASEDFDLADQRISQAAAIDPEAAELDTQRAALTAAREKSAAYEQRWAAFSTEQREAFASAISAADTALDASDLAAAKAALASAAEVDPAAPELAPRQARLAEAQGEVLAEVQQRLDEADAAIAALADKPENAATAAAIYREVAAQYPDEARASAGLAKLEKHYVAQAKSAADAGKFDTARAQLADGEKVVPGGAALAAFTAELPALEADWEKKETARAEAAAAAEAERKRLIAAMEAAEDTVESGKRAVRSGDLDTAMQAYESVLAEYPDLPSVTTLGSSLRQAYAGVAREKIGLSEYDAAADAIVRAERDFPGDPLWQELKSEIEEARTSSRRRLGVY